MVAIEYMRRNMARKGWIIYLVSECFFIGRFLLAFFIPLAQKALIDATTEGASMELVSAKALVCLILAVGMGVLFMLSIQLSTTANGEAVSGLLIRAFERLIGQRYSDIQKKGAGWYRSILYTDVLPEMLAPTYSIAVFSVVQFISILIIVGRWSLSLVYAILAICAVYLSLVLLLAKIRDSASKRELDVRLKEAAILEEGIDAARVFSRFGRKEVLFSKLQAHIKLRIKVRRVARLAVATTDSLWEIASSLAMVALVLASLAGLRSGAISTGALVTIIAYIPQMLLPSKAIGDIFMFEAWASGVKKHYMDIEKRYQDTIPLAFDLPNSGAEDAVLELRDIGFSYVKDEKEKGGESSFGAETSLRETTPEKRVNISGISLSCSPGTSTALLGLSGEGKSTLIKLMTGEELPSSGEVRFCGAFLRDIPAPMQRSFINVYSQDTEIVDDDVRGNILVGKEALSGAGIEAKKASLRMGFEESLDKLAAIVGKARIKGEIAAQKVCARELEKAYCTNLRPILGLPLFFRLPGNQEPSLFLSLLDRYSTREMAAIFAEAEFGRSYCVSEKVESLIQSVGLSHLVGRTLGQRGGGISGGERQRIALARCLAKENWKFLIIDEPFTSLDALAEEELSGILQDHTKGRTILLVTHKLNLVPLLTERVVIMKEGAIAAQGSHRELKATNSLYASLWKAFSSQRQ